MCGKGKNKIIRVGFESLAVGSLIQLNPVADLTDIPDL